MLNSLMLQMLLSCRLSQNQSMRSFTDLTVKMSRARVNYELMIANETRISEVKKRAVSSAAILEVKCIRSSLLILCLV